MTPVQTCKGCGKLFSFLPRGLCAGCIDHRESQFQLVRDWLVDNHSRTISAVTEGSGVEQRLIAEFVREGRLELVSDDAPSVREQRNMDALRARMASEIAMSGDAAQRVTTSAATAPPAAPTRHSGMRTRS